MCCLPNSEPGAIHRSRRRAPAKPDQDLLDYVGADVIGINNPSNMFGVPDSKLVPFRMPDGTPTLISGKNAYDIKEDGSVFMYPQGIRRFDEWLMAHMLFPEYIQEVFEMQTEVMLKNLEIYRQAVGSRIQIVWISGTDFGTQNGEFFSVDIFRKLYKPYYKRVNDWVHQNTSWKTFYHCCGSIVNYLDDFVDMGVDILNPVQVSAKGMDPHMLKDRYGGKLVFWGAASIRRRSCPSERRMRSGHRCGSVSISSPGAAGMSLTPSTTSSAKPLWKI